MLGMIIKATKHVYTKKIGKVKEVPHDWSDIDDHCVLRGGDRTKSNRVAPLVTAQTHCNQYRCIPAPPKLEESWTRNNSSNERERSPDSLSASGLSQSGHWSRESRIVRY
ncbi:hypothetical protein GALMADRAFT_253334 [Galerina marginata CBS 339.88]|uniref:Uncharacterized protein n=1 Tax=Galerina marginata (strain CBS 339.88) TaxID=685588 RepID=A0A067SWM1_GALM3|nr:hypothetical protein GALMADRAFT_253334 [Galerina marginata CBS 339.88]